MFKRDRSSASSGHSTFVHIGMPKAASSYLQQHVISQHSQIEYLGKNKVSDELHKSGMHIVRSPSLIFDLEKIKGNFTDAMTASGKDKFLYSEEDLCTYFFLDMKVIVLRLGAIFGDYEAIFVHRRQVDWIKSLYYFYISTYRPAVFGGINAWLEDQLRFRVGSAIMQIRTDKLLDIYSEDPNVKKLHVLPYEQLRKDANVFYRQLAGIMDVDEEEMIGLNEKGRKFINRSKKRIGILEANFIRTLRFLRQNQPQEFRNQVEQYLPGIADEPIRAEIKMALSDADYGYENWVALFRRAVDVLENNEAIDIELDDDEIAPELLAKIQHISRLANRNIVSNYSVDLGAFGYDL